LRSTPTRARRSASSPTLLVAANALEVAKELTKLVEAHVRPSAGSSGVNSRALGAAALFYIFLWASAFRAQQSRRARAPPLVVFGGAVRGRRAVRAGRRAFARRDVPRSRKDWVAVAALGILGNAVYLGCTYIALRHLASGVGAIVASTNPLTLALVAPWLLREPLTPAKILGCCSASAGSCGSCCCAPERDRTAGRRGAGVHRRAGRRRSDDRVQEVLRRARPAAR